MPRTVGSAASSVPRAVGSLYDRAIDRMLARPYQVATADEARALLDDPESIDVSALADQIQQVAIIAIPIARRVGALTPGTGLKRVPWVLTILTVANVARSIRQGVREVQVVGSYLAARLHATTGEPPDPALVKALTVQVYLSPSRRPSRGGPLGAGRAAAATLAHLRGRGAHDQQGGGAGHRRGGAVGRAGPPRRLSAVSLRDRNGGRADDCTRLESGRPKGSGVRIPPVPRT